VLEALNAGAPLEKIFLAFGQDDAEIHRLRSVASKVGVPVSTMDKRKFTDLERELQLDRNSAQGIIALRPPRPPISLEELLQGARQSREDPIIVVLDGITDPHNLGAIARSAEGVGAVGLIVPELHSSPVTPVAVKASAGALEHLPVVKVKRISTTLVLLRENGWKVIGTATPALAPYHQADMRGPVAIVIGNEGEGLHPRVLEECSVVVEIPMFGQVASLNASVAAGIVLFEAARQRAGGVDTGHE
jgi:23S rRNA (guanosine2251-2'-O)-methyltransferase